MKTLTIIIIVLFLSASLFFSVVLIKKSVNDKKISNLETSDIENTQGDSSLNSDNSEISNSSDTAETSSQTVEETTAVPSSDNISDIEIYLDGDKNNGIFLGKADYG